MGELVLLFYIFCSKFQYLSISNYKHHTEQWLRGSLFTLDHSEGDEGRGMGEVVEQRATDIWNEMKRTREREDCAKGKEGTIRVI